MKIEDLQKAWVKYSSKDNIHLDEKSLEEMLGKRTKSLIERIDRNVKIGFVVLLGLILYNLVDYFVVYPNLTDATGLQIEVPVWIMAIDLLSMLFIILTFIYFAVSYYRVKNQCSDSCSLKDTLIRIIGILKLYKSLFFFALVIILVSTSISFVFGLYYGISVKANEYGLTIAETGGGQLAFTIMFGLVVLILLTGGIFLLFRWGFRKLYGNYLLKLKHTLKELTEIEVA